MSPHSLIPCPKIQCTNQLVLHSFRNKKPPVFEYVTFRLHQPRSKCYPIEKTRAFFTTERIAEIGSCHCDNCPAGTLSKERFDQVFDDKTIKEIRGSGIDGYIGVLALLLHLDKTFLIFKFIEKKYTDRYLATPRDWQNLPGSKIEVLPQGTFGNIFELDTECKDMIYDEWKTSFQFLIPPLSWDHRSEERCIYKEQIAPFNIIKLVGNGGFAKVYEAQMLKGYHDFRDIPQDGKVAIKQYRDDEFGKNDCDKEMSNNVLYKHERIMAVQAALHFRETYMHIYPLAETSLQEHLTTKDPIELYREDPEVKNYENEDQLRDKVTRCIWRQYQGLLSALDHIHYGSSQRLGYHFDLKPDNILIYNNKWAITDLGMAHYKLVPTDAAIAQSLTSRKAGNDTYGPPERSDVTRAYDIFSVGAIGCDVLAWIKGGHQEVAAFKIRRQETVYIGGIKESGCHYYHLDPKQKRLNTAVIKLLEDTIEEGGLLGNVASVLKEMLSYDRAGRPRAKEAEKKFANALGRQPFNVPPPEFVLNKDMLQVPGWKPQQLSLSRRNSGSNQQFPSDMVDEQSVLIPKVHVEDTQEPMNNVSVQMATDDEDSVMDESGYESSDKD
ncbi:kinase-like domain-containing protein [Pyronema omphalodes]|nr:kinase-like domain-containing protein [Pyronema omphalodes]